MALPSRSVSMRWAAPPVYRASSRWAEQHDLLDEVARPLGTALDPVEVSDKLGVGADMLGHHLGMPEDAAEDVVEIMRDAAGEDPDLFHPLRMAKARFQPVAHGARQHCPGG